MTRVFNKKENCVEFEPTPKEDWWKLSDSELELELLYLKVNLKNDLYKQLKTYMVQIRGLEPND